MSNSLLSLGRWSVPSAFTLPFCLGALFRICGCAALWNIVVGSAGTKSRVAMGPWMIGSALVGTIAWGVVPDWL